MTRWFRTLASRLVMLGVLQTALIAATAGAIWWLEGPHGDAWPGERIDRSARAKLEQVADKPDELAAALAELRDQRIEVSVYDADRALVATNVDPPLAIPARHHGPPPEWRDGRDGAEHRSDSDGPPPVPSPDGDHADRGPGFGPGPGNHAMVLGFTVHGKRGYLVARGVHTSPGLTGPLLTLICGFIVTAIGALITARWILRPIERLSGTARAFGAGDLAARSRLDRSDEIGELGRGFDEMAHRIERLLVAEKELLANVAHELRTPLSRIGVALDLAGEGDSDAARASLSEIAVDVTELETIVDDILTAMRFEVARGGELPLRRAVTSPASIATAAVERLRSRHSDRPIELETGADLGMIDVDPRLFRRAIDNLLENAHKYTPDRAAPIRLAVSRAGDDAIAFEVSDRGIGIAEDDLPRIFTAFFRSDRSRSRETGGVGLGLTLAKRIVEAHAGKIDVTSAVGVGTTMKLTVSTATTRVS